jgi:hypothetical protein
MPTSKQTTVAMAEVIREWASARGIGVTSVLALLDGLCGVKGNKSFTESIRSLRGTYERLYRPRPKSPA